MIKRLLAYFLAPTRAELEAADRNAKAARLAANNAYLIYSKADSALTEAAWRAAEDEVSRLILKRQRLVHRARLYGYRGPA